jgi:hypothetical protein
MAPTPFLQQAQSFLVMSHQQAHFPLSVYFLVFPAVSFGEPTSHSPLTPGFEGFLPGFFPGFLPFPGFFFFTL